jgi:hypothetical protein
MSSVSLIQLLSSCIGIIGSVFFSIGVMTQTTEAMAQLSGSCWDSNPHMLDALAQQKADYLFGSGCTMLAFFSQLVSYFASGEVLLSVATTKVVLWVAVIMAVLFFVLRFASKRLAIHFKAQVTALLERPSHNGA